MVMKIDYERSLKANRPDLHEEWDYEKNEQLNPGTLAVYSHLKVWWKCKNGHSWDATISNRSNGSKCPFCTGKRPIKGENDLGTLFPSLAIEFDENNNGGLSIHDFTVSSGKRVGWCCAEGHQWKSRIQDRTNYGVGCPYCAGTKPIKGKTDLKKKYPDIAAEWDYEANINLNPDEVTAHSGRVVGWKCTICDNRWEASVNTRSKGHGCPYCAGNTLMQGVNDLETMNPILALEWAYDENGDLLPSQTAWKSNQKVIWKCIKNHYWEATVNNRAKGQQCPYCAGKLPIKGKNDFATKHPELLCEWDWEENKGIHPSDFTEFSKKKASWVCPHGHKWKSTIQIRSCGHGCPICANNRKQNKSYPICARNRKQKKKGAKLI